jgi:hypothetical protein
LRIGANPFKEPIFKDLENFVILEKLFMYEIFSLNYLNGFPLINSLTNLDFDNCRLKTFKNLPSLPNLVWLLARENGIEQLDLPLLPSLKYLLIPGNKIKDIDFGNNLPSLVTIILTLNNFFIFLKIGMADNF